VIESMSDRVKNTAKKKIINTTINYCCIRCGYETEFKSHIRSHFERIKPCPTQKNVIELTNEIKEIILKDRQYIIPIPDKISKVKKEYKEKIKEVTD
jgi:hypothetical protein